MIRFGPSVDDARTVKDVEFVDPWTIAAVPVPVLFSAAQGAMACGAWVEARDLLTEVVWLEPGFEQDGQSARELLAQASRAYARAMRRKRTISPWPVLISVAALVFVPVAAGLATAAFGSSAAVPGPAVFEPVSATVGTAPTVTAEPPALMAESPVVTMELAAPQTEIAEPPTVMPVAAVELPSQQAEIPVVPIVVPPLSTMTPRAPTPQEVVIRQSPARQDSPR